MPKIENTKYERWYQALIEKARSLRPLEPKIENTEKHHILPRCLKGTNTSDNLVRFSIREHYLAHLLLLRMYDGPEHYKLEWALFSLAGKPNRRLVLTSRQFEKCRQTLHSSLKGRKQSPEHVRKRTLQTTGSGNGMHHSKGRKHPLLGVPVSNETKKLIGEAQKKRLSNPENHPMFGRNHTQETKTKISEAKCGIFHTKKHKENISLGLMGHKNSDETRKKMSSNAALNAEWSITSPEGNEIIIRGLKAHSKEQGWNYNNLMYALRTKKPYLGYTIQKLQKDTPFEVSSLEPISP